MRANDVRSHERAPARCVRVPASRARSTGRARRRRAGAGARRRACGLVNEFEARGGHPPAAVAFLRRVGAAAGARDDDGLLRADAVVHVAAPPTAAPVAEFCAELARTRGPGGLAARARRRQCAPMSLHGQPRCTTSPTRTGCSSSQGPVMPNCVPRARMSKTAGVVGQRTGWSATRTSCRAILCFLSENRARA